MYLFYLDGTLYDNPGSERSIKASIKRDQKLYGLVQTQDTKVKFMGEAYEYLYDKFFDSLCNEVEVEIWRDCGDVSYFIHEGVIKISDMRIDFQKCIIETNIEDRGFFSYINNNKNLKIQIGPETLSKSGEIIDQLELYEVDFFDPCTGSYYGTGKPYAYRIFDVMQFVLDYITDGRFELQSDLLTGGQNEIMLTKGESIRIASLTGVSVEPEKLETSFQDLYDAIQRVYNVAFRIERPTYEYGKGVFRIEEQDYFYKFEGDLTLEDVKDLTISVDNKDVYGNIRFGGADFDDEVTVTTSCAGAGVHTGIDSILDGWTKNDINLTGQCNTFDTLDLGIRFQIASNVIEDSYAWSTEFDSRNFLLEVVNVDTVAKTCDMAKYDYYGTGLYYYNIGFNNLNVLQRRGGYLHNSVQQYQSLTLTDQFRTSRAGDTVHDLASNTLTIPSNTPIGSWLYNDYQPIAYDDVTSPPNFNNGSNYDTALFQYTCPETGNYTFTHFLDFKTFGLGNRVCSTLSPPASYLANQRLYIVVGFINTTTGDFVESPKFYAGNATDFITATGNLPCTSGDVIEAYYKLVFLTDTIPCSPIPNFGLTIYDGSYFSCNSSPLAEGAVLNLDTKEYKAILMDFEYPLDGTTFRDIEEDPTQLITITSNNRTFAGWIDKINYNHLSGRAEITLRTNAAIQDT